MLQLPHLPKNTYVFAIICALIGTFLYGIRIPANKFLVLATDPVFTSSFAYAGTALGMLILMFFTRKTVLVDKNRHIAKSDIPYLAGSILTSIGGAVFFVLGLVQSAASNASLINNLGPVATALIAFLIFREKISKRLWIGICFTVLGCIALSVTDIRSFSFTSGSLLIMLSCLCYAFNNNFTKCLSQKNPIEIVIIRAVGVAAGGFAIAFAMQETLPSPELIGLCMLVGFLCSGLHAFFQIYAQRFIGAAKTGAVMAFAPVIGVIASFLFLGEEISALFIAALVLVIPGMYFTLTREKDIPVNREVPESGESPLFASMPTPARDGARNYLTAFGFIFMSVLLIMALFNEISKPGVHIYLLSLGDNHYMCSFIVGTALILCSILLFILRKRAFAAVTFFFIGVLYIIYSIGQGNSAISFVFILFCLILGFIFLTAKEKQKYLYFLIILLQALFFNLNFARYTTVFYVISVAVTALTAVFLLYLAFVCASEKAALPLRNLLTGGENIAFSKSGCVLGFLVLASNIALWMIEGFSEGTQITLAMIYECSYVYISVLILIGSLMLFIGKNHFYSFITLALGFCMWLDLFAPADVGRYVLAFLLCLIGVFAVCRNQSTLLFAIMLIGDGFTVVFYEMLENFPELITILVLCDAACIAICLYHAFAVFSEKPKLPLF
ncbi:MAG TPA: DMT family transporter [Methanocorpusculum sp.]|nr:DMT family transporter [Methanocorpusculum sp.]